MVGIDSSASLLTVDQDIDRIIARAKLHGGGSMEGFSDSAVASAVVSAVAMHFGDRLSNESERRLPAVVKRALAEFKPRKSWGYVVPVAGLAIDFEAANHLRSKVEKSLGTLKSLASSSTVSSVSTASSSSSRADSATVALQLIQQCSPLVAVGATIKWWLLFAPQLGSKA
jgi:hypothetical protein